MTSSFAPGPRLPHRITLASQTAQSLRDAIEEGHWHGHLPGERELCARLQVSRQTLRVALDELQREGVLEVTDRKRRTIKSKRAPQSDSPHSKVIAALSTRPLLAMSPSAVVMLDELRDHLTRAGFSLQLHVSPACFTAHPARALDALTTRSPAAAWILWGSLEPMQTWFIRRKLPCLVAGSCAPGVTLPSIDNDHRATCRHAGAMLRRNGHRRIVFVRAETPYGGDTDSEEGVREALAADPSAALEVIRHNGSPAHIITLLEKSLRSPNPPTACIVARALSVLTIVSYLQRRGIRIPQDMAVVSRDDEVFLEYVTPNVTRYASNPLQFARRLSATVRQLAEAGALPPRAIRLMPRLMKGETV
jgi:DNA-binding LacI/PurR family transcriptional regulator